MSNNSNSNNFYSAIGLFHRRY